MPPKTLANEYIYNISPANVLPKSAKTSTKKFIILGGGLIDEFSKFSTSHKGRD